MAFAARFAPGWMETLTVRYDPAEGDIASVSSSPEYRNAAIRVGNSFFADDASERRVSLTHEVMHGHIETLAYVFNALLESTTEEDSPLRKWAKEQWRQAEEGCVCDLSRRIVEAFREPEQEGHA